MFKKILVPIDGSPMSYRPVAAAIEMAKAQHGSVVLLSVAEPRLFASSDIEALHDGSVVEQQNADSGRSDLAKAIAAAKKAGVPCESVLVHSRIPGDEIVAEAQQRNCDAIFMSTRGKMDVLNAIFDESTTQQVLQHSKVPVLVFP